MRAAAPDGVDALIDLFGPDYLDLGLALGVKADRLETIISFERACQIGAKDYGGLEATDPATIRRRSGDDRGRHRRGRGCGPRGGAHRRDLPAGAGC